MFKKRVVVYSRPDLREIGDEIEITFPRSRFVIAVGEVVGVVRAGHAWDLSAAETLPANGMDRLLVCVVAGDVGGSPASLPGLLVRYRFAGGVAASNTLEGVNRVEKIAV